MAISIAILYFFNIEKLINNKINILSNTIKSTYIHTLISINDSVNKYLFQLDYIDQLVASNKINLQYKTLYEKNLNELVELNKKIKIDIKLEKNYEKVRALSYYKFNDHSQVVLDYKNENDTISALLTYDGFSAGIVLNKDNKSIAYLNQHKRCNYTVFIGDENAPGITSGVKNDGNIIVKYVPIWKSVKIGDEVITSSMDSIFPYGIKVGKVDKIVLHENTKDILVSPYADTLGNRDYYHYTKKIEDSTNN